MDGSGIGSATMGAVIAVAVMAFGFGALVMWGVPKLWELVKPWIHALTA